MPKWVSGYVTREIMLLEFSSSIMCLILAGKVGSNIASEIGTMRVTQQIDALEIMGVNSASYVILPKIVGMLTMIPLLVIFSTTSGIVGAYATAYIGHIITPAHLTEGIQYDFNQWYFWMGVIKSFFFASSSPRFRLSTAIASKAAPSKWEKLPLMPSLAPPCSSSFPTSSSHSCSHDSTSRPLQIIRRQRGAQTHQFHFEAGKTNLIIGQSGSGRRF